MNARRTAGLAAVLFGIAVILAMVGGPAAVASYHHAYQVFVTYGEAESRAAWLPLTTDGMLAAALIVMYSRRWAKQRVGVVPWLAFTVGFFGTLAANLASANAFGAPTVGDGIGRLAAAVWAPISFAVTLELVAVMLGRVRDYVTRHRGAGVDTWPITWQVGIPDYPYHRPAEPDRSAEQTTEQTTDPVRAWLLDPTPDRSAAAVLRTTPDPDPPDHRTGPPERTAPDRTADRPAADRPGPDRTTPARTTPARTTGPDRTAPDRTAGPDREPVRLAAAPTPDRTDNDVLRWIATEWERTGSAPAKRAVRRYAGSGAARADRLLDLATAARSADEDDAERAS